MPDAALARPDLRVLLAPDDAPARTGEVLRPDDAEKELRALHAHPAPDGRPWVRANMVATLDGAAAGPDGRSGSINGPADLRVFTALRSQADVVLVGAGTARAERYDVPRLGPALRQAREREGRAPRPQLAVVTTTGNLPDALLCDTPTPWVLTTSRAAHLGRLRSLLGDDHVLVLDGGTPDADAGPVVDLAAGLRALADAGLPRVLAEGGPSLLGALARAHLLDELFLTVAPVLVAGDALRAATGPLLDPVTRLEPLSLLLGDGMLLGRWRVLRG